MGTASAGSRHRLFRNANKHLFWISHTLEKRSSRLERERQQREWEERELKRAEKVRLLQEEESRFRELEQEVIAWRQSEDIRAYIAAVKSTAIRKHGRINPESGLGRWLTWANQQADRVDPLSDNPTSILVEID